MPTWIHARAEHLLAKNPSMTKSKAFAIATNQAHATGKAPKDYGTKQGKYLAKATYLRPKKDYEDRANPGKLESHKMEKESSGESGQNRDLRSRVMEVLTRKKPLAAVVYEGMTDELGKIAFAQSQYSGDIEGPKKHPEHSGIPSFIVPSLRKKAFAQSQYSGDLSQGRFPMVSGIPSFHSPDLQDQSNVAGMRKIQAFGDNPPDTPPSSKEERLDVKEANVVSPLSQLRKAQREAKKQVESRGPAPSLQQQFKPEGFGKGLPGMHKGGD